MARQRAEFVINRIQGKKYMKKPGEIVFLFVVLCLSVFLFVESLKFPFIVMGNLGAGVWPAAITGLLILLITTMLAIDLKNRLRLSRSVVKEAKQENSEGDGSLGYDASDIKKMLLFATVIFIYILMLQYIGFIFSTPLFIVALLKIQNQRMGFYYYLIYTIGSTLMLVVVFSYFFHIYLPRGIGIFRVLSRALY
jgi:putative tricarboxylic transport membrane protein